MSFLMEKKQDCCGCTACLNVCPTNAIEMIDDDEGFKTPYVKDDLCINCGLCKKVCSFNMHYDRTGSFETPLVFAVKHKNETIRAASTSGGMFTALSDNILHYGGVVYGAAFEDDFSVVHKRATTFLQRNEFRGSKYVQSDLNTSFQQIKEDLQNGKNVLFSGTPCQCSGLKSFLNMKKTNMQNLLLCDFVCHGVPSPLVWKSYIELLQIKSKQKVSDYQFRSKDSGWHKAVYKVTYENNKTDVDTPFVITYKNLFYSHLCLRLSCHNCPYTNLNRCSDITIGDFWGIEKTQPEFDDNKGISLVLVNTPRGKHVFDAISKNLDVRESDTVSCLQSQLKAPASLAPERERFWSYYRKKGYLSAIKRYTNYGIKNQLILKLKRIIIKIVRK